MSLDISVNIGDISNSYAGLLTGFRFFLWHVPSRNGCQYWSGRKAYSLLIMQILYTFGASQFARR